MKIFICRFLIATLLSSQLFFVVNAQNMAIQLDGTDDYATTNQALASGSSYTMEAWINTTDNSGLQYIFSSVEMNMKIENTHLKTGHGAIANLVIGMDEAVPVNQWAHVAVTHDAATQIVKLYLNGQPLDSNMLAPSFNSGTIFIGSNPGGNLPFRGKMDEVRIWDVARSEKEIKKNMFKTVPSNSPGLVLYYDMNEGAGTTLTNLVDPSGTKGDLFNSPSWVSSSVEYHRNALNFDGVDDQVTVDPNALLDLTLGTIECWVKPGNLAGNACFISNSSSGEARWGFYMSDADNLIGFLNNSGYYGLPYTVNPGQWYHVAFVCDGTNVTLYVNGDHVGVIPQTFTSGATNHPVNIGTNKSLFTDKDPFEGEIDEVRIWNDLRTQTEIQSFKNVALTGTESGLIALFNFDQGISDGDNTGMATAIDNSHNNLHGQLLNFALNGTSSNWVEHAELIPLPVRLVAFTAKKHNNTIYLHWQTASEQNSRAFTIEKSNDGTSFRAIGTVAAAGNSSHVRNYSFIDKNPESGNNFYRLVQADMDGSFRYSTIVRVDFPRMQKLNWYATGNRTVEVRLQSGSNERYSITDMNGRTILKGKLSGGTVRLPQLAAGSYSIHIQTASGSIGSVFVIR